MAQVKFFLPDVGEGIHEAEIVRWLVEEGERVTELDGMVEVQTDKALVELPAPTTGFIDEIKVTPGAIAHVGDVLVVIETTKPRLHGTEGSWHSPDEQDEPGDETGTVASIEDRDNPRSTYRRGRSQGAPVALPSGPAGAAIARPRATPGVRHYARQLGIDLWMVEGTGHSGRILKQDVDAAAAVLSKTAEVEQKPVRRRVLSSEDVTGSLLWTAVRHAERERQKQTRHVPPADKDGDSVKKPVLQRSRKPSDESQRMPTRVPFRGVRRATAEQVKRSAFTVPHVTAFDECDATELVRLRTRWNKALEPQGQRVSYLPFLVKATVSALKAFPYFNARLDEDAQEIELLPDYHIGIAVDTPDGLFVPVLRNSDDLTVQEIGEEIYRLSTGAKQRTLTSEDLHGSTFSITNMGPIGGLFATPIINYPEVAILAVHKIGRKPVADGDNVVIRDVLTLSLSFDHRVIDGATSVRFLNHIKALIEDPERLMLELR